MKTRLFTENGQALILIAVSSIALIAFVALAIDGSRQLSDRRHAQNAADTAALAGALAKVKNDPDWVLAAKDRAAGNGYTGDLVQSIVEVYNPPISGIYSDCSNVRFTCTDYIQVIITSYVDTTFARVIGFNRVQNRVQAVAGMIAQNNNFTFGGNAIIALSQEGCGLVAGGTTNVVVNGGGLFSNSADETCSFKKQSCAGLLDVNNLDGTQGNITSVGGYTVNTNCMPQGNLVIGAKQISFPPPYQELPEPAECSTPGGITWDTPTDTTTLTPGYFDQIPGNGNKWKTNVILTPGVYCIGTAMRTNNTEVIRVAGTFGVDPPDPGVFLYFKPGGYFTFNGGSGVQLWGINQANIDIDPSLSVYKGFLMYLAPDYASGSPSICTINGTSGDAFQGTIYAPYCDLKLNGTSDTTSFQSQLIGYTVDLTGASGVTLNYTSDDNAIWNIPLQVGLSR